MDYKLLSQVTADDYTQMAKAILLYLLGAYIFANEGQKISLKWLALFRDFREARDANWGRCVLPTCTPWTHLAEGLCAS